MELLKIFRKWNDNKIYQLLKIPIVIGFFVALFLIVFQPFGLYFYTSDYKYLFIIGFGVITFIALILFKIINYWRKGKIDSEDDKLIFLIIKISFIAVLNFIYAVSIGMAPFNLSTVLLFIFFTFSIAFLVRAGIYFRKNITQSNNSTDNNKRIKLASETKSGDFYIEFDNLIFIRSCDNYCEIHYLELNKKKVELIRNSLRSLEKQLEGFDAARCHRSYIINYQKVLKVTGSKSAGFKIKMIDGSKIPVSKGYADIVNEMSISIK